MRNIIDELYAVILARKADPVEGSYTCYLFEKGLDKILKKCGEESAEVIIAAKNNSKEELIAEMGDLFYHVLVLMAEVGVTPQDVYALLEGRREKTGNTEG